MFEQLFLYLSTFEDHLWGFVCVPLLIFVGLTLTFNSNFFQVRKFPYVIKSFFKFLTVREEHARGVHPLKAFFACVGGCVGIGNIAGICSAVQIGGPGALFWIWVTAFVGVIVKYSEVYLGILYRVPDNYGGYSGGPMYFLQRVFKSSWVPKFVCLLLCVYGVEVYQFSIVTESIVTNLGFNQYAVIFTLLGLVVFAGIGGIRRVGNISSTIIPVFILLYVGMGSWVLINNITLIPQMLGTVFNSAFTENAAIGGFIGSTIMMTISQGVRRGCYTSDLGVGYASVIHSESQAKVPQEQAALVILDVFLDTFIICTTSVMLILVTGVWHQPITSGMMVQAALSQYFPYMQYFMPLFLFLLGYSTINAYFIVGLKCAAFIAPKYGRNLYFAYAGIALTMFSFGGTDQAQTVMTITNGLLLLINCYGIFCLRKEVSYELGAPAGEELAIDQELATSPKA